MPVIIISCSTAENIAIQSSYTEIFVSVYTTVLSQKLWCLRHNQKMSCTSCTAHFCYRQQAAGNSIAQPVTAVHFSDCSLNQFLSVNTDFLYTLFLLLIKIETQHIPCFKIKIIQILTYLLFTIGIIPRSAPDL